MAEAVDLVVQAKWVVPMRGGAVLEDHAVAVRGGRIVAVGPKASLASLEARERRDLGHQVLLPGLVNAHTHSPMTLLRSYVDNVELMDWLQNCIWPAEGRHVDEHFIRDGTELAVAEMIRAGVTCFADMYFFPGVTADVVDRMGVRAGVGVPIINAPTPWAKTEAECVSKGTTELLDRFKNHDRIKPMLAPHAPYTVTDEGFTSAVKLAKERNLRLHTHLHETEFEVSSPPERPLARLGRLGMLSKETLLAHMVHLTDEEVEQVAKSGAHVVHCPGSNLKLASGLCNVAKLQAAGVNVCLGTDGASSNDDLDMFSEVKLAAFVSKLKANSPVALSAHTLLEMATVNGARALGWDDRIGTLEVGMEADIISVSMKNAPIHDVAANLVYASGSNRVSNVWVAGRQLLNDGKLVGIDEAKLTEKGSEWAKKITIDNTKK